jgi:1,4-dihydroxy-2-naphthoate octaprenyltransferase
MADEKSRSRWIMVKTARPMSLLSGLLTYFMGVGLAVYLGHPINWGIVSIGAACMLMLQTAGYYLNVYFDWLTPGFFLESADETPDSRPHRQLFLQIAIAFLTTGAVMTVLLYLQIHTFLPIMVVLGMAVLIAVFYGVPPVRLVYSGYGELAEAILLCNIPPTLAFLLQTGDMHRLVAILSFPVTLLYMAMLLAFSLPNYARNLKYARKNLMVRMGWQTGMILHNILIFSAYTLLVLSLLINLPLKIALPGIITLPLGIFQIWQVNQIAVGAKPHWRRLIVTAYALPLLLAYLFTATLWIG